MLGIWVLTILLHLVVEAPPRMFVLNTCSIEVNDVHRPTGISGTIAEQFCLRGVDAVVASMGYS